MMWEDETECVIEGILCPICKHKFVLPKEWWNEQPEFATECPLCDGLIWIDKNYHARDLRYDLGRSKVFVINRKRYDDLYNNIKFIVTPKICYIEAKEWPNYSEQLRKRLWQRK